MSILATFPTQRDEITPRYLHARWCAVKRANRAECSLYGRCCAKERSTDAGFVTATGEPGGDVAITVETIPARTMTPAEAIEFCAAILQTVQDVAPHLPANSIRDTALDIIVTLSGSDALRSVGAK